MPTRPEHWSFDRRINISHILTTLTIVAGIFAWGNHLDKRISLIEERQQLQAAQIREEAQRRRETYAEIRASLERIEEKLDGKLDKDVWRSQR